MACFEERKFNFSEELKNFFSQKPISAKMLKRKKKCLFIKYP
jgi:hypothetical protein